MFCHKQRPIREDWGNGVEALSEALNLETQVTKSIQEIIRTCETPKTSNFNDYHVSSKKYHKIIYSLASSTK